MNISELRAELGRHDMSIPALAEKMGISKKQLYERFHGKVSFTQKDILSIKQILDLSNEKIILIFFTPQVS